MKRCNNDPYESFFADSGFYQRKRSRNPHLVIMQAICDGDEDGVEAALRIAKPLLERGVDVHTPDKYGHTPGNE